MSALARGVTMEVTEDAYFDENHTYSGKGDDGESVTFEPDSSGDYHIETDDRTRICDWDGRVVADVFTHD